MSAAITIAWLSSLCLALMIIFDRLMIGDCYRNRPNQAWFVSSVGGMAFGLLATAGVWILLSFSTPTTLHELFGRVMNLAYPHGLLMFVAGTMTMQVLYHYFHAFIPEDGREVNETALALWLASSPAWIFITIAIIHGLGTDSPIFNGLEDALVTWTFGVLMLLSVGSLVAFELAGQSSTYGLKKMFRSEYIRSIVWIQIYTVGYTLVLSGALRPFEGDMISTVALLPFYFVGFGAGIRILLRRHERKLLARNWPRLRIFSKPIIVAEVIGASVFFLEFFALSRLDPTLVNLIIAAHVIPVFVMTYALRYIRKDMEEKAVRRKWVLGIRFSVNKLPPYRHPRVSELLWLTVTMLLLMGSVLYVT